MKGNQVIQAAQKYFEETTGLKLSLIKLNDGSNDIDGELLVIDPQTGRSTVFFAEIKNEIRTHDLYGLKNQSERFENLLLIAQYISKKNKEQLRNLRINYIESSGNCYIKRDGLMVFVDSQRAAPLRQTGGAKLFSYPGMKLIYALLLDRDLLSRTYRDIAYEAEIGLGSIGDIIRELNEAGYLIERSQKHDRPTLRKLFEDWVDHFDERMIPHMLQQTYVFADKNSYANWSQIPMENLSWGGEPGAWLLDRYLVPEVFVVYSSMSTDVIEKQLRLVPNIKGNVVLMTPPLRKAEHLRSTVDPYLIYAELMRSDDSRCHEAAQRIREKHIDPEF